MGLMVLVGFGAGCAALVWCVQAAAMVAAGHRQIFVLPLRHRCAEPTVRWPVKLSLHACLVGLLVALPMLLGTDAWSYHAARLAPAGWGLLAKYWLLAAGAIALHYAICVGFGWVRLQMLFPPAVTARKILRSFVTPLPLSFMEEAIFRGIVLDQLLTGFAPTPTGQGTAVVLSAAIFSSVHFFRPQKRTALPAFGLFLFGILLGVAYLEGGRTLWIPVGIHAGGVWALQFFRTFAHFRGPAWLIGYCSYPICGVLGSAMMAGLLAVVCVAGPRL